jgi:hypothetical protein
MLLLDRPNTALTPTLWPGLTLLAATAFLETDAEPELGQLAVAFNPCNRARRNGWDLHNVILGPEGQAYGDGKPYEPYSCWNDDYRNAARRRLAEIFDARWEHFYGLAAAAWWQLRKDPSGGAYFYLNVEETKRIRGGTLPDWWDIDGDPTSEVRLGKHTFRGRKI